MSGDTANEHAHIQRLIAAEEAKQINAELVRALRRLVTRVELAIKCGRVPPHFASDCLPYAQAVLAKIGGNS